MDSERILCLVCNQPQNGYKGLGHHIKNSHNLSSEDYYKEFFSKPGDGICKQCGASTLFRSIRLGYQEFCSRECSNNNKEKNDKTRKVFENRSDSEREGIAEKARKTREERYGDPNFGFYGSKSFSEKMKERYGDEHYNNLDKIRHTNLERYGTECIFQSEGFQEKSLEVKREKYGCGQNLDKLRDTNRKRFGSDYYVTTEDFKDKTHQSLVDKYGSVSESYKLRREKSKKTLLERYGDENYYNKVLFKETLDKTKLDFCKQNNVTQLRDVVEKYGQGWYRNLDIKFLYFKSNVYVKNSDLQKIEDYSKTNHNHIAVSNTEKEVLDYVRSIYNGEILENKYGIIRNERGNSLELDIYIPDKRIAIEFNGIFWHSLNSGTDRNYHRYKTKACEDTGIRLIHIFEDQWINKRDICKSILSSSLGVYQDIIYARDCEVREVNRDDEREFLLDNHMQGHINSSNSIGLYKNGVLVQLVSFGKSRFSDDTTELYRMCTKKFTKVAGGFSKLIKHSGFNNIVTYVDRSLFDGSGYQSIGFSKVSEGTPGYFYVDSKYVRYNRMSFQKKLLKDKLSIFDENLSEIENMMNNGYYVVFDSGNDKYVYNRE